MIKNIVTNVEELSNRAAEIDVRKQGRDVRATIIDIKDTIRKNNLPSLTAPQIGSPIRAFVINFNGDLRSYCNPMISSVSVPFPSCETSPSIPGKKFLVFRYSKIVLNYMTPMGEPKTQQFVGMASNVVQQCVDALDGILISDIGMEVDENFENFTAEEKERVIKEYAESLDFKIKELKEEIENDKELKQFDEAITFNEKLEKGEIELQDVELTEEEIKHIKEIHKSEENNE